MSVMPYEELVDYVRKIENHLEALIAYCESLESRLDKVNNNLYRIGSDIHSMNSIIEKHDNEDIDFSARGGE